MQIQFALIFPDTIKIHIYHIHSSLEPESRSTWRWMRSFGVSSAQALSEAIKRKSSFRLVLVSPLHTFGYVAHIPCLFLFIYSFFITFPPIYYRESIVFVKIFEFDILVDIIVVGKYVGFSWIYHFGFLPNKKKRFLE
jgi:hypothetical protein